MYKDWLEKRLLSNTNVTLEVGDLAYGTHQPAPHTTSGKKLIITPWCL
jgi:hypothetical protein